MTSAGESRALPAPFLGTVTFIGLSLVVPILIVESVRTNENNASAGAALIAAIAGARFAWAIASRRRHIVEMVFWLFVYGFLGIAPMTQMRMGIDPGTTPHLLPEFSWLTVLVILAGMLAVIAGSATAGRSTQIPKSLPQLSRRVISTSRLTALSVIVLGITAFYMTRIGVSSLFISRNDLSQLRASQWADPTVSALIAGVATMGVLVCAVAQILLWKERKRAGAKKPLLLLLVTLALLGIVVNPISSPRYVFGVVYLALIAALGIYSTLRRYRIMSLSAAIGLFFVFPVADAFRRTTDVSVTFQNPLNSLISGDFDSFGQISNTVYYVHAAGIEWGRQLFGVALFWVPRSIWTDKPIDTGVLLAQFRGYSFTNLSAPLWSELFINGGWVLLLAGMFTVGYAIRVWDGKLDYLFSIGGVPTILGCVIPFYLLILLRGSLLQAVAPLAVILLCTWLATSRRPTITTDWEATHKLPELATS